MTTGRVIVGLDESSAGRRALSWALRHAQDTGAAVEVVSVYRPEAAPWAWVAGPVDERAWTEKEQDKAVKQALRTIEDPPTVIRTVTEGDPVQILCAAAEHADLLVLGTHGKGLVATALLGSVSAGCIHAAKTPVVVVPAREAKDQAGALEPVTGARRREQTPGGTLVPPRRGPPQVLPATAGAE